MDNSFNSFNSLEHVGQPKQAIPHRKVVMITGVGNFLYALCSDGSIWRYDCPGWLKSEKIPVDTE